MPFIPNDTYLTRGENSLIQNTWTSSVYKFDASTFYNWEQDNLPIYDLEERTDLNWQMQGYPTSSITGINLVVSGNNADTESPYKVFSTVSGALETLPKSLRFPVIIEVCTSGDLGEINVEDFEFYDSGGLEIINRGMAKLLTASAVANSQNQYYTSSLGSGFSSINLVSSLDLSNTMADSSALGLSANTSADLDSSLWGRTLRGVVRMADQYLHPLTQAAYGAPGVNPSPDLRPNNVTVMVQGDNADSTFLSDGTPNVFTFTDYLDQTSGSDYNAVATSGNPTLAATGPYEIRNTDLGSNLAGATAPCVTGFMYANTVRKLLVRNCTGPVYIRGFCVDGAVISGGDYLGPTDAAFKHDRETGIIVEGSDIVLENCAVMRCRKQGAKFENSRVVLNRGFTAYRNYDISAATSRVPKTVGYGLVANNSEVTLSAAAGPLESAFPTLSSFEKGMGLNSPFSFASNDVGIQLNNSVLKTPPGGRGKDYEGVVINDALIQNYQLYMDAFLNLKTGIEINNSDLDVNHTLTAFQNAKGMKIFNSRLDVDELIVDHNQGVGLEADNSQITYYRTLAGKLGELTGHPSPTPVLNFLSNGTNIKLTNTFFKAPEFANYLEEKVENRFQIEGIGYSKELSGAAQKCTPGTILNNSVCELLTVQSANGIPGDQYGPNYASILGTAYLADNNSYLKFMGASGTEYATYVRGPSGIYPKRVNAASVYADNNSTVEFNGPTVMNNAGINAGANNNSTVRFSPHNRNSVLAPSAYCLSDTNMQTRVLLQSYKTCLGANNNSTIEMVDCGDFNTHWKNPDDVDLDVYVTGTLVPNAIYNPNDREGKSVFVSGGYMQFYPNPEISRMATYTQFTPVNSLITTAGGIIPPFSGARNAPNPATAQAQAYYKYSQGGWCVRADKGSEVLVKNVHFPCGFLNPSSTILDVSAGTSGTLCGKTFLWGIGDDSRLHASYVSISGHYPSSVPYNGPSGVYVSAPWDPDCPMAAISLAESLSAAPSATPDTGRLSVLDTFGLRKAYTSVQTCAAPLPAISVPENKGPFRIYFSVNPVAKFIGYTRGGVATLANTFQLSSNINAGISTGTSGCWRGIDGIIDYPPSAVEVGEPYQVLAQGYNPSRDCSSVDGASLNSSGLSGIYHQLAWRNPTYNYASGTQFVLGGTQASYGLSTNFFYGSAMTDPSYASRVWLDDSAMNAFANAKNCAQATSGRNKLVSYYRSHYDNYGAGFPGLQGSGPGVAGTAIVNGFTEGKGLGFKSTNIFDPGEDV